MLYFWIVLNLLYSNIYADCDEGTVFILKDLISRQSSLTWGTNDSAFPSINDRNLRKGWYSGVQNGWQYVMTGSETKLIYTRCNTYWPIQLKEPHPPLEDLTENPTIVKACVLDEVFPCSVSYDVKIRKCNGEIQYYLTNTIQYAGYCFDKHSEVKGEIEAEPAPTDVDLGHITVVPKLLFEEKKEIGNAVHYIPHTAFQCSFNHQNYFYAVDWYIGSSSSDLRMVSTKGPKVSVDELYFREDDITDDQIGLGIEMKCGVSVSRSENGLKTGPKFSSIFFAGITISDLTLFVDKNSVASVKLRSTVPLGCYHQKGFEFTCKEEIQLFEADTSYCKWNVANKGKDLPANQRCPTHIESTSKTGTWAPNATYSFEIATIDRNYDDNAIFKLKLRFVSTRKSINKMWTKFVFPDIKVVVQNTEAYKKKICYCHIDPHMKTADGTTYEMQNHMGTYRMYRNTKYNIEVQIKTTLCNFGIPAAKCTCAVAIRAGKDVFLVDICGTINYFGFTHCGEGGILHVVKKHDNEYNIHTPIGTLVTVKRLLQFLNIDITMAPKDLYNTEGLCGYFDDNPKNDFVHLDGTTSKYQYHPDDFTNSWKIDSPKGLGKESSLFQLNPRLDAWKDENSYYCVCDDTKTLDPNKQEGQALCSPSQYLQCDFPEEITHKQCQITRNRKRRSLKSVYDTELERLIKLMEPVIQPHILIKRQATRKYSETEAREVCTRKINGSLALSKYSDVGPNTKPNVIIEECIYDITVGEDVAFVDAHVESLNTAVKNMMDKQPVYVAANTEKVEVFLENTCSGNCSGMGNCTKAGECICQEFRHGSDCSIDERNPLTIDDIEGGGLCDVVDGGECMCFIVRSDNILEGFSCNVQTFKISLDGKETFMSKNSSFGDFKDIFTGLCCIPHNILGSTDVFVAKYTVSISNNGINYGNEATMYVYDSSCQNMTLGTDNARLFSLKENHCFIDGYCFSDNDMAQAGCLACRSDVSNVSWSEYNPCQNDGNCSDMDKGYLCSCVPGYKGRNCEIEIDECSSNPCKNGGICIDSVNGFNCSCLSGYEGSLCEQDIDECLSSPCQNNASCEDLVNRYNCSCADGFKGIHCETDIDECFSNPCKHSHVCIDLVNGYRCQCRAGFEGTNCAIDINECTTSRPCQHGGTCTNIYGGYSCACTTGYEGNNCDTDTDDCLAAPCRNNGSCTDKVNGYLCSCRSGFEGSTCETEIDECASNPCKNNGSCTDMVNGYMCSCQDGYEGENCEIDVDECASNPCQNDGSCNDMVNGYKCFCQDGYGGKYCEINTDECVSAPCKNNGFCTDLVNRYNCFCQDGYEGQNCEIEIDECASNPCKNNGSCTDMVNGYMCSCQDGYVGENCEIDTDECVSAPCKNNGFCTDLVNGYNCFCQDGYEGQNCEIDTDECASAPCKNDGFCTDLVSGYNCFCQDGYEGQNCEIDKDECTSNPCINNGSCTDLVNGYNCTCQDGFEGSNCEMDTDDCASVPCKNGGKCIDEVAGYNCSCEEGYEGRNCEIDTDECASSPCQNDGFCRDMVNGYNCSCREGYEGSDCERDRDDCASSPCRNGGFCNDMVNGYNCFCQEGYEGGDCEIDTEACASSPCQNGGFCRDMVNGYNCSCLVGYQGNDCEIDTDDCASSPCQNRGFCRDMVNAYNCSCREGYEGDDCEIDTDDCASSPCQNGGVCNDMVNGYNCSCQEGYEGSECEIDTDDCASSPCQNRGFCRDMVNAYNCYCRDGYEGDDCEIDTDDCASSPCQNGGVCNDMINGYNCSCQEGYEGNDCEKAPQKTKKLPLDRSVKDRKVLKKLEYLEGKLQLQEEKRRYLTAKTELVKQKTLYYRTMAAIAGRNDVLRLNSPDRK